MASRGFPFRGSLGGQTREIDINRRAEPPLEKKRPKSQAVYRPRQATIRKGNAALRLPKLWPD